MDRRILWVLMILSVYTFQTLAQTSCQNKASYKIAAVVQYQTKYINYTIEGILKYFSSSKCFQVQSFLTNNDRFLEFETVHNLVKKKFDGIALFPVDAQSIHYCGLLAKYSNVPLVDLFGDKGLNARAYLTSLAIVDSEKIGKMIANYLLKNSKPGKTIVIQAFFTEGFSTGVSNGLSKTLNNTKFTIVFNGQGFYSNQVSKTIIKQALTEYPDATSIITFSGEMGNGVADYLKEQHIKTKTHISVDMNDVLEKYIRENVYVQASAYYSGALAGYSMAYSLKRKILGNKFLYAKNIPVIVVTKQNIDGVLMQNPYRYPQFANKIVF
ncbi:unnamed protein product [Didymodactylos carnosus]|uniref:Periplasmic binding protein domain-containing protein n=1 Tax=Didymodactylos carnosus TaxID=1234261 RepID=A0A814VJW6_9BILA|nr:unnamed protein product [Didymodactylos carnosus]CAF1191848.1 unnamed protein product [Didymodactylos carnosus]CAF3956137.1 unnamed protein product [Didymodactylos carnosus]CAF3981036.1 unnamed protein product [Didymodactylos carnosus]